MVGSAGWYIVRDHSIFCIGEIQSDLQDMGLPNYSFLAFEPSVLGLRFGLMQRGLDITLGAPLLWTLRVGLQAHFSNPINIKSSYTTVLLHVIVTKIYISSVLNVIAFDIIIPSIFFLVNHFEIDENIYDDNKNVVLSQAQSSIPHDAIFVGMYNIIHIDEKWFYMTKKI